MDEYVLMNKSDLTTMADTIRETLGSTDSIAVGDLTNKLIEAIEAGGSVKYGTGTYIPSTTTTERILEFKHSLDEIPALIIFYREGYTTLNTQNERVVIIALNNVSGDNYFQSTNLGGTFNSYNFMSGKEDLQTLGSSYNIGGINSNSFKIRNTWIAGNIYRWIAFTGVIIT